MGGRRTRTGVRGRQGEGRSGEERKGSDADARGEEDTREHCQQQHGKHRKQGRARNRSCYELDPQLLLETDIEDEADEAVVEHEDRETCKEVEGKRKEVEKKGTTASTRKPDADHRRRRRQGKDATRNHRTAVAADERREGGDGGDEAGSEAFDEQRANLTFLVLGGGFLFSLLALLGIGIMDLAFGPSVVVHTLASILAASIGASVVLTYALGGRAAFSRHWRIFQPLRGGVRFVTLQIFSWTLFAISLALPTLPLILALFFPASAFRGAILAAGIFAFVSQVVMATSIITYHGPAAAHEEEEERDKREDEDEDERDEEEEERDEREDEEEKEERKEEGVAEERVNELVAEQEKGSLHPVTEREARVREKRRSSSASSITYFLQSPQGHRWWTSFIGAQVLLSLTGLAYSVLLDVYVKHDAEPLLVLACLCCLTAAIFLTYGVGGRWAYSRHQWTFYQPFVGGPAFIVLQMLAWTFFGTAAFVFMLHILYAFAISPPLYGHWETIPSITTAGIAAFVAQVTNVASLFVYSPKEQAEAVGAVATPRLQSTLPSTFDDLLCHIIVWSAFNMEKYIIMFFAVSLLLTRYCPTAVVTTWVLMGAAYVPTFAGTPSMNGSRMLKNIVGHWFVEHLAKYFRLAIHKHFEELPRDARYIVGYHPHGIFPATCLYMTRTKQWAQVFPGFLPAVLSSSIVHYVPLFRDIMQLFGGYEVSRGVFVSALKKHGAVLLIPGGQAEMISSRSDSNRVVIDTTHRGFVKVALEQAAQSDKPLYLLPVYAFNETRTLDNVRAPLAIQRWVTKVLKANVIYLPYGQFGLPGYPRTVPISVAVGKPVLVPEVFRPTRAQVDVVYRRYLDSLREVFEAFKADAGCDHDTIVFSPTEHPLTEEEYTDAWNAVKGQTDGNPKRHRSRHNGVEMMIMGLILSSMFWTVVWVAYNNY